MSKEIDPVVLGNVTEACFGPWVTVASVTKGGPLHPVLKPHVQNVPEEGGVPSVPARLVSRVLTQLQRPL